MRTIFIAAAMVLALSHGASAQTPTASPPTSGNFVRIDEPRFRSQLVGVGVRNQDDRAVGQIVDIAMSRDGKTQAYILSVGSFLGLGEHYIAVDPASVKVGYSEPDKVWHASMNATPDQVKAAPPYRYSGRVGEEACINILR